MIVVYQSSTGFTKQYALWIAEALNCEAMSLKEASDDALSGQDRIIFGGWVMGGTISGLKKIEKLHPEDLVVFAVGATPPEAIDVEDMKAANNLISTPLFYLQGGFHFNELSFPVRAMLKTLKRQTEKKPDKTPQEQFMADGLGTSFDASDKTSIDALVAYVQGK